MAFLAPECEQAKAPTQQSEGGSKHHPRPLDAQVRLTDHDLELRADDGRSRMRHDAAQEKERPRG